MKLEYVEWSVYMRYATPSILLVCYIYKFKFVIYLFLSQFSG